MRTSLSLLWVCLFALGTNVYAGTKGEWVGWLSDAKCAANGAKASHKGCALKCVEAGQAIVLLGDRVQLSGSLEGDTIKVDSARKTSE
jgi:hypothetical protein